MATWSDYLAAGLTALHPSVGIGYRLMDDVQANDALKAIQQAQDTNTLLNVLDTTPTAMSDNRVALQKAAAERKLALDTSEAKPVEAMLNDMQANGWSYDPTTTGRDWIKGMAETMYGYKPGEYDQKIAAAGINGNQLIPKMLQNAEKQAQKQSNLYHAASDVGNDRYNPSTIAEFLAPGGYGELTNGDKGTGGASLADKLIALKKAAEEGQLTTNMQQFLNAVGKSNMADTPALNAIYAATPKGIKPADLETITKNTNIAPTISYHDIGGPNNTVQLAGFDTRGNQVNAYGVPTDKRTNVNVSTKVEGKGMETFLEQVPKHLENAISAQATLSNTIAPMKQLLKKGAGGVQGYALSKIAPALQMVGYDTKGMNEAQLYQALSQTIKGTIRQQVIGSGPVSNFEQELMDKVSGGGAIGADAAQQLLNFYETTAKNKIKTYKSIVSAAKSFAPKAAGAFESVDIGENIAPAGTVAVTPDGKRIVSDGQGGWK